MHLTIDPMSGWFEPIVTGRCSKPCCECDDDGVRCWVCVDEWAAMMSDAEIHGSDAAPEEVDPWLAEVHDPLADNDVWDRMAQLEDYPDA